MSLFCAKFVVWCHFNLTGAACTYMRFFPYIKKNYDYGVVIFLLTFNLITVSSYRVDSVLQIAHDRFFTIAIGCGICLLMSLLIFPNWSGEDLHNSTVFKLEGLANSIEGMVCMQTLFVTYNFSIAFLTEKSYYSSQGKILQPVSMNISMVKPKQVRT